MARIRSIKPDFFRHAELYDAERKAKLPLRLAFAGLWTAADREGRFKWEPRALKLDCLPYDDVDFSKVLEALWEAGFIAKYQVGNEVYGCIPSWKSHQHVNVREAVSKLPEPSEECMCAHVHASDGREGKGREGKGTDISTRDASVAADFENFKKEYPKRGGSNPWQPALALYKRALRDGETPESLRAAASRYRAECEKNQTVGTEKVCQAQTWFRQSRYFDYRPPPGLVSSRVFVEAGSAAWLAWQQLGKTPCVNGGWYFESEYPPGHEPRAA